MKVQWFSVLSIAGIVLLAGNSFGGEVQWKTPAKSGAVAPSVTNIPTVITTDDADEPSAILQVQQVVPAFPPRLAPSLDYPIGSGLPGQNPLPGATFRNGPPAALPSEIPARIVKGPVVPCDDLIALRSIREISHDIRPTQADILPKECEIVSEPYYGRHFAQSCYMWKASALSTKAAYFEDTQLERHGHTLVCPALQPVVSGVKFFATVPLLPYKMGVTPPNECVYTLGHYRSGSCAPYMVEPFPISARGALFEAGAVAGAIVAIP